jgi:geranylgeranylglycerol-phosphate geranylgeranyltransferase
MQILSVGEYSSSVTKWATTNLSSRLLPSGRISIRELGALISFFTIFELITAVLLGPVVLVIVFVLWRIALLYNMKLKELRFFGSLIVAFCLGMIFVLAGILAGHINEVILTSVTLVFFFDLGEEIARSDNRSSISFT